MPFQWSERQFVGGALCLDFVNTVFYGEDPERRGDRLSTPEDIAHWCTAAHRFGSAGRYGDLVAVAADAVDQSTFAEAIALRLATDGVFRTTAHKLPTPGLDLRAILFTCGRHLAHCTIEAGADGLVPTAGRADASTALAALAHSALSLAQTPLLPRIKACPNCHWLFVDRSRNASRVWCDMLTCGNRAKMRRYHEARRYDH